MKVYYLNEEYETGKHKIRKVWAEFRGINEPDIPNGCSVLEFDEYYNRKLARDLMFNSDPISETPDVFYIDNSENIRRVEDDSLVTINANPQKAAYKLSQLYGLTHEQLDTYIDNNVTNLSEVKEFVRKLAHITLWLVKQTKLDE